MQASQVKESMLNSGVPMQNALGSRTDPDGSGQSSPPSEQGYILLLTTDGKLANTLERLLARNGYRISVAGSLTGFLPGDDTLPTVAIIDRRLDLIEQFRRQGRFRLVPSIALSPVELQFTEEEYIRDLDRGYDLIFCSDRYRELLAQIRALFRRARSEQRSQGVLRAGSLVMDLARYEITVDGADKSLTNKEFEILRHLLSSPGHVLSRQELLNRVWGIDYALEEHALDVHIHSLRRKIEPDPSNPQFIITVRGIGYKVQGD